MKEFIHKYIWKPDIRTLLLSGIFIVVSGVGTLVHAQITETIDVVDKTTELIGGYSTSELHALITIIALINAGIVQFFLIRGIMGIKSELEKRPCYFTWKLNKDKNDK